MAERIPLYETESLWLAENPVPAIYPWLYRDEQCDVCVVGGGITGALCALRFAQAGVDTVLLAAGPVGYGATAYSAGILQPDVEGGLQALSQRVGIDNAVQVYAQCAGALDSLEQLASKLEEDCGFARRDLLTYSSQRTLTDPLHEEYLLKKHNGFSVELLNRESAGELYSFDVEKALLYKGAAAVVDPFRLTHQVIKEAEKAGARVYENTSVEDISHEAGQRVLATCTHHKVTAEAVVLSIGMDCCDFLKGAGGKRTTFFAATRPVEEFSGWKDQCVIRCTDRPEVTFSVTPQGRILACGLETGLVDRNRRMAGLFPLEVLAEKKAAHLQEKIEDMFPGIRETTVEYAFTGDSIQTDDGLPVIGTHEDYPGCYFALCTGRNGPLFSEIAARMLVMQHQGDQPEGARLYSPKRL